MAAGPRQARISQRNIEMSRREMTIENLLREQRPSQPVFHLDLAALEESAGRFVRGFPGRVLYAVKCNPMPEILRSLWQAGIRDFDVASLTEALTIREMFGAAAGIHFNNPAKDREAIVRARRSLGVRHFVVDHPSELDKVLIEAAGDDLVVTVRLATPPSRARYNLSAKHGATPETAVALLRAGSRAGARVGLAFHVGSQCLDPAAYAGALDMCGDVVSAAGVPICSLNVGGGFPAAYPGDAAPSLETFFTVVESGWRRLRVPSSCDLLCEPGRALVASAGRVIAQVLLRKGNSLYLNDGVYGTLSELRTPAERRPTRLVRLAGAPSSATATFTIFGPTCDAADVLAEPVMLPEDADEGDWIEFDLMGAYSTAAATTFNGFSGAALIQPEPSRVPVAGVTPLRAVGCSL